MYLLRILSFIPLLAVILLFSFYLAVKLLAARRCSMSKALTRGTPAARFDGENRANCRCGGVFNKRKLLKGIKRVGVGFRPKKAIPNRAKGVAAFRSSSFRFGMKSD